MDTIQSIMLRELNALVESGRELGAQFCAYHGGKLVVDAWAGKMDENSGREVRGDTLFPVFSVTKGFVAAAAHILAEKGRLDYDMKISEIWPEFAANGKENATVRHALGHLTGIPQMPADITVEDMRDWRAACGKTAALTPKWPPGTAFEYHPVTFGWIVGEILRRLDGRPVERIIYEEICRPLGLEDVYLTLPESARPRVATLYEPGANFAADDENIRAVLQPLHEWMNGETGRGVCLPSTSGIMSARSLAGFYVGLLPGGADGAGLLPESRLRAATDSFSPDANPESGMALGFNINRDRQRSAGGLPNFGHSGYGGASGFAFPEAKAAIGFTKNLFGFGDDSFSLLMDKFMNLI